MDEMKAKLLNPPMPKLPTIEDFVEKEEEH